MDYQTGMTQAFIYRSLIVLIALVGWILGYRLLSGGLTLREGEVRFKIFGQLEAKTAKVTSGSVFFVCGTIVLLMALVKPVTVRVSEPGQGAPGTVEIIAQIEKAQGDLASRISGAATALEQVRKDQEKTGQHVVGAVASLGKQVEEVKKQVEETKQLALGATVAPWVTAAGKPLKKGDIIYGWSNPTTGSVAAFKVSDPASLNAITKKWDSLYVKNLGLEPVTK